MPKQDDILASHKSDPKPNKKGNYVLGEKRLPYPVPLRNHAGQIQYPLLKERAVIFFNCYISREKRCCEVWDESSMYALYQHGYFGKGSLSSHAPVFEVVNEVGKSRRRRKSVSKSDTHLQQLKQAFSHIPETQDIIDDLYEESTAQVRESNLEEEDKEPPIELEQEQEDKDEEEDTEKLRLSLEEVFFLSYGLGCMNVTDPSLDRKLNLKEIWNTFCQLHCGHDPSKFAAYYAAYHHFRAKGWVVKSGTKFGCDFTLYKEGPAYFHSLFSVIVYSIRSGQKISDEYPNRDWLFLSPWARVSEGVKKYPVLCTVTVPESLKSDAFQDPRVIQSFTIETTVLRRFEATRGKVCRQDNDA